MEFASCFSSEIGDITLVSDGEVLTKILFGNQLAFYERKDDLPIHHLAKEQLKEYFAGKRREFQIPYRMTGTIFQEKVWKALLDIPYGETLSYGLIAAAIHNPKGSRAVGMANNRNVLPIIIPCHRVIGKNGTLVGYAGGLEIKTKLLDLEKRGGSC